MYLFIVLNKNYPGNLPETLKAIAQLMLELGPQLTSSVRLQLIAGSTEQIRRFNSQGFWFSNREHGVFGVIPVESLSNASVLPHVSFFLTNKLGETIFEHFTVGEHEPCIIEPIAISPSLFTGCFINMDLNKCVIILNHECTVSQWLDAGVRACLRVGTQCKFPPFFEVSVVASRHTLAGVINEIRACGVSMVLVDEFEVAIKVIIGPARTVQEILAPHTSTLDELFPVASKALFVEDDNPLSVKSIARSELLGKLMELWRPLIEEGYEFTRIDCPVEADPVLEEFEKVEPLLSSDDDVGKTHDSIRDTLAWIESVARAEEGAERRQSARQGQYRGFFSGWARKGEDEAVGSPAILCERK